MDEKDRFCRFREYEGAERRGERLVEGEGLESKSSKQTERRFLARANYDPSWRVKGNPICITRRASYRHESTRYLHLHASFFASFVLFFFPSPSPLLLLPSPFTFFPPAAVDQVPLGFSTRRLFIETGEPGIGRVLYSITETANRQDNFYKTWMLDKISIGFDLGIQYRFYFLIQLITTGDKSRLN